eukprot:COSAG01_NODE_41077_length_456_cov_0.708683_1_plen_36_part_01
MIVYVIVFGGHAWLWASAMRLLCIITVLAPVLLGFV